MTTPRRLLLITVVLLTSAILRLHALGQDWRFHPDEALFSTFARSAALNGDWLLPGSLDKPPLSIYASAVSMVLFAAQPDERGLLDFTIQQGEFAARLPNAFAGILLIAVVYAVAYALYRQHSVALSAAALLALSPFAAAFSATAFTDGLMLLGMTAALWLAVSGRWGWSGVCLALAFATKQQALFYLPLIFGLGWLLRGLSAAALFRFFFPLLLGISGLVLWDAARQQPVTFWVLAYANNDPARLIRANEVLPRLVRWLDYGRHLFGAPTPLFAALIPLALTARIVERRRRRSSAVDAALLAFVVSYLLVHWLVAFNTYDRYLLPLLPPLALLAARSAGWLWRVLTKYGATGARTVAAAVVLVSLLVSAGLASEQRLPFSDRNGSFPNYAGIDALADFLNAQPLGAIVYDHWLNWELGFYMGQWSDKRRVYYPSPDALVAGALQQPDSAPRYFPAPASQPLDLWLEALTGAGFAPTLVYETPQWVVYQLIPPRGDAADAGRFSPSAAALWSAKSGLRGDPRPLAPESDSGSANRAGIHPARSVPPAAGQRCASTARSVRHRRSRPADDWRGVGQSPEAAGEAPPVAVSATDIPVAASALSGSPTPARSRCRASAAAPTDLTRRFAARPCLPR